MATDWVSRYLEAWNSHDGGRVAAFMADDGTYEDLANMCLYHGRDEVRTYVEGVHEFSTDYRFVTVTAQTSDAGYAIEWEMLGTNTGESGGVPATGKPYRIRGASVGSLDSEGRITVNRDYWNLADYLAQVGIVLPTGT